MTNIENQIEQIRNEASTKIFQLLCKEQSNEVPVEVPACGISFRNLIDDTHIDLLFKILNKLTLPKDCGIRLERSFGKSFSKYFLVVTKNDGIIEPNFFKDVKVEDSYLGAFQAYLLDNLWRQLPLCSNAHYAARFFIYSPNDIAIITKTLNDAIDEVLTYNNPDDDASDIKETIQKLNSADTSIQIHGIKGLYYISYCFWSIATGLYRVFCEIQIENNKILDIKEFNRETIIKIGEIEPI